MNIVHQVIYDLKLEKDDDLGDELYDIMCDEKRSSKHDVIIQQVIKVDRDTYTVILNHINRVDY
ncbi:MAG: hypothetical protein LRY71_05035 [Bacillaceae bacterium]|nr:hypothetical protein [Bacillaceae bacterium]